MGRYTSAENQGSDFVIKALVDDLLAFCWMLVVGAIGSASFILFCLIASNVYLRFSFGLTIALLCAKLSVLVLWALSERWALNPNLYPKLTASSLTRWIVRCLLILRRRFYGFAHYILVLPLLRSLYQRLAGIRSINKSVVLVGAVDIDLISFVSIGENTVVEARTYLISIDYESGQPAPIVIGRECVIQPFVTIGGGTKIGSRVVVGTRCVLGRNCLIEDGVVLKPRTVVSDGSVVRRDLGDSKAINDLRSYPKGTP
jgi:hypothetical protein